MIEFSLYDNIWWNRLDLYFSQVQKLHETQLDKIEYILILAIKKTQKILFSFADVI